MQNQQTFNERVKKNSSTKEEYYHNKIYLMNVNEVTMNYSIANNVFSLQQVGFGIWHKKDSEE